MKIGYIKENDAVVLEELKDMLRAERLFVDKHGEERALQELMKFVRTGDQIVVRSVREICHTAGEFVEFVLQMRKIGVDVICKEDRVDTSNAMWIHLTEVLTVYDKMFISSDGSKDSFMNRLERYFERVDAGELTVQTACDKLQISKTTYYRHRRQRKGLPEQQKRHPELFAEYHEKVECGEMNVEETCRRMGIGKTTYYRMKN